MSESKENPVVNPGDKLVFEDSAGHVSFGTVAKVTPSGRIVIKCGLTLNPDLTVRGRQPYSTCCYKAMIPTPELLEKARRQEMIYRLAYFSDWRDFTNEELEQVYAVVKQVRQREMDRKSKGRD
jgi:hypothetical protein